MNREIPEFIRERAKDVLLQRVNEAREVLSLPALSELDRCVPNDCIDCVLAHHLNLTTWTTMIDVRDPAAAELLAEKWQTRVMHEPSLDRVFVVLPNDLHIAMALFDAGADPGVDRPRRRRRT